MIKRTIAVGTIRIARRLFAHTRVHSWPITTRIARRVFRMAAPAGDETIEFRGQSLTFPTEDVSISAGLVGGYYERLELDLYERVATTSRTILDVGGNVGIYACAGAGRLLPGGRVITFEPVPGNLEYLRRNVEANGHGEAVTVEPIAVGDQDGELTIHLAAGSTAGHSVSERTAGIPTGSVSSSITVPVRSLDSYLAEHGLDRVDVIKIDVEGFDIAVLRGAAKTLASQGPALFVEYAPDSLRNCGFDPTELLDTVFAHYPQVLVINEPKATVRLADRESLVAFTERQYMLNLVGLRRPEHLALFEDIAEDQRSATTQQ